MKFESKDLKSGKYLYNNILMANGLGGYTSTGVYNNMFRKHDAYLVASLDSPIDRHVLFRRTTEYVDGLSLDSSTTNNHVNTGYRYMTEFSYFSSPVFVYEVKGTKITKEISPIYGSNAVAIAYDIKATEESLVDIVFEFSNSRLGEINTLNDLDLNLKNSGEYYSVYYKNLDKKLFIYISDDSIKSLNHEYTDNIVYNYDKNNGDERFGIDQKLLSLQVKLNPGETKKISITMSLTPLQETDAFKQISDYKKLINQVVDKTLFKDDFLKRLAKSSFQFLSYRKSTDNLTILAGYPWFTDWGRDTMISLPGICLATNRFDDAFSILNSFKSYLKNGLIPNSFLGENELPIYNSVDAPLWYINSVYKYLEYTSDFNRIRSLYPIMKSIVENYKKGTIFDIYMNDEGLIHAGNKLDQLTWMDVRINNVCVTPRHGYPVEINSLWYNSLMIMNELSKKFVDEEDYLTLASKVKESFKSFIKDDGSLYDVIGPNDPSVRPNQLYAYTLPFKVLDKEEAKKSFTIVKKELFNKYGLRSLSFKDSRFKPFYGGDLVSRDYSYHMGTSWTFLIGVYIDALCYINDYSIESKNEAKTILREFDSLMSSSNLDGICEVYDGKGTYDVKGCYNQAWGVSEVLRSYIENIIKK